MEKEAKKQKTLGGWVKGAKTISPQEEALKKAESEVTFYGPKNANGWMSNFYPSPFMVGKILYPTN